MPISTAGLGVDDQDDVIQYVPPGTSVIDQGNTITYGTYVPVAAGEQWQAEGVVQIAGGSGQSQVVEGGEVTYRIVTIVMPS